MKNRNTLLCLLIILTSSVFAQNSLNDYKYIIVEKQFHFQNEPNQYNLNRLVKFEFEKLGFNVLLEDQGLPDELKKDICLALNTDISVRGALRTKAVIKLINCSGELVYQSAEGISKEKDFKRVFQLAIQKAFDTMAGINHNYVEKEKEEVVNTDTQTQEKIQRLEAEVEQLKAEKEENHLSKLTDATNEMLNDVSELKEELKESAKKNAEAEVSVMDEEEIPVAPEKSERDWREGLPSFKSETYGNIYMKPGYEGTYLVNDENETVFKLLSTSKKDIYLVDVDGKTGVAFYNSLFKNILIEYYENDEQKTIRLDRPD